VKGLLLLRVRVWQALSITMSKKSQEKSVQWEYNAKSAGKQTECVADAARYKFGTGKNSN